jgi:hypothetical protein
MKPVFDFSKSYTGTIHEEGKEIPSTLTFKDNDFVFNIITGDHFQTRDHREPFDFTGIISTDRGIWKFKASDAIQTSNNYYWSNFSRQELTAASLIVSYERNDIALANFRQANVIYEQLSEIGIYIDVDINPKNVKKLTIKHYFEKVDLLSEDQLKITLHNPYGLSHKPSKKIKFSVTYEPFITIQSEKATDLININRQAREIGWFFQLIFSMRQDITGLILFDHPIDELPDSNEALPYFYFQTETVRNIRVPRHAGIPPLFWMEDLLNVLPNLYQNWHAFSIKQRLISKLFFNELNSRTSSIEDRFKNLCAIIQGLDAFPTASLKNVYKGEMNRKLRNALDNHLESVFFTTFGEDFIAKLFEIIGDQRDLYQHLSKTIKFDLSINEHDMIGVNQLMATIIRYHLWRAVAVPEDKIKQLISRDKEWFKIDLFNLKRVLGFHN